ncbi:unnamed protein product [Calypogeia fissa]
MLVGPMAIQTLTRLLGTSDERRSGIGLGYAKELCRQGFNVIIHGCSSTKLEKVEGDQKRECPNRSVKITIADALERNRTEGDRIVGLVRDLLLAVLINNVGGAAVTPPFKSFERHTAQDIDGFVDVNEHFTMQLTNALFPVLKKNEPSLVFNVGSMIANLAKPYLTGYAASRPGLMRWSANLAAEMRVENRKIEVLGILVGQTKTELTPDLQVSLTVPSAMVMAASALQKVGCGRDVVPGYLPHTLQGALVGVLPSWLQAVILAKVAKKKQEIRILKAIKKIEMQASERSRIDNMVPRL